MSVNCLRKYLDWMCENLALVKKLLITGPVCTLY